ncbi:MAG: hypothetical protein QM784_27385, partial [Polyangiaceae bacterium]
RLIGKHDRIRTAPAFAELSKESWNGGPLRKVGAWIFRDWRFVQRYYRTAFRQILEKNA